MELERIQGTTDSDSMRSTSQVQLGGCQPWKVVQVQLEEPLTWLESYICSIFLSNYSRHQVERSMTWNSWISRRKGNPYSTFGGAVDGSYLAMQLVVLRHLQNNIEVGPLLAHESTDLMACTLDETGVCWARCWGGIVVHVASMDWLINLEPWQS